MQNETRLDFLNHEQEYTAIVYDQNSTADTVAKYLINEVTNGKYRNDFAKEMLGAPRAQPEMSQAPAPPGTLARELEDFQKLPLGMQIVYAMDQTAIIASGAAIPIGAQRQGGPPPLRELRTLDPNGPSRPVPPEVLDAPKTTSLGDTLKGSTATDKAFISRKAGGYAKANAEFDALTQGSAVKPLPGKTPGRIAEIGPGHPDLPEGTIVNVREKSSLGADRSGGQPTIEIRYPDGKQVKIRYDD